MLTIYYGTDKKGQQIDAAQNLLPTDAIWYDLESPSLEEEKLVEKILHMDVPTRDEMNEIEVTSRLYRQGSHDYLTALVINHEDHVLKLHPVTFILHNERLITVRYGQTKSFDSLLPRLDPYLNGQRSPHKIFLALLELVVDESADVLEALGGEMDKLARRVFQPKDDNQKTAGDDQFKQVLRMVGREGENISLAHESLLSVSRLLHYLQNIASDQSMPIHTDTAELRNMQHDIDSLTDHADFLTNKVDFILSATLGMINVEQNAIIKIFSVATMIFMPPTLIASIYGMNFKHMPELDWHLGYPLAILLMIITAVVPYMYFKKKGWL